MNERGTLNLHLILTIFLGFGMVLFGALAIISYHHDSTTQANLAIINAQVAKDASEKQKHEDDVANTVANELPYRTYTADPVDGGFSLQIPKEWSLFANKNAGSSTQLILTSHPSVITIHQGAGALNSQAFELQIQNRRVAEINRGFEDKIKSKKLISKSVTVSGIQGSWYEGVIDEQRHNGVVVTLPVRDKSIIIKTDSHDYLNEFKTILDGAKIIP